MVLVATVPAAASDAMTVSAQGSARERVQSTPSPVAGAGFGGLTIPKAEQPGAGEQMKSSASSRAAGN
jgi:hypothetical protein